MGKTGTTTTGTGIKSRLNMERPIQCRVLMHNDDYTTMEFVVDVLGQIFHKRSVEANLIMLQVHHKGQGVCGIYPFEIAETKVHKVHEMARAAGFPLRCTLEEI